MAVRERYEACHEWDGGEERKNRIKISLSVLWARNFCPILCLCLAIVLLIQWHGMIFETAVIL